MAKVIVTTVHGAISLDADLVNIDGDFLRFCFNKEVETERVFGRLFRSPEKVKLRSERAFTLALVKSADVLSVLPASAIEAATAGETTKIGSTEGESAVPKAGAQRKDVA